MRLLRLMLLAAFAFSGALSLPYAAEATPIGPSCGTCQGSTYELSYSGSPITTTATTETFRITYTIDTSGYSGPGEYLDAVALKVSSSFIDATLVSAPGGIGNWIEMTGGLAAAGCSGSGAGFDCVMVSSIAALLVVPAAVYTLVFDIEIPTGTLFTGLGEASVKARYVTESDGIIRKAGALVSEGITLTNVPEPQLGLLLLAAAVPLLLRRRAP